MTKELAVVLYILSKFPEGLYQTMLYKFLFYVDFYNFSISEKPLTDSIYFKLPYGPVPLSIKEKIDILIQNQDDEDFSFLSEDQINEIKKYKEYIEDKKDEKSQWIAHKLLLKKDDGDEYLSDSEKLLIDSVLEKISKKIWKQLNEITTKDIVDISHEEKAYKEAEWWQPLFYGFCDDLSIL